MSFSTSATGSWGTFCFCRRGAVSLGARSHTLELTATARYDATTPPYHYPELPVPAPRCIKARGRLVENPSHQEMTPSNNDSELPIVVWVIAPSRRYA